jgi:RNA polymerase sigma factor (sigma-70 family)
MATGQPNPLLSYIRRLATPPAAQVSDRELLQRFAAQHDETAFAALVQRHGPMVLNVGRRILHNGADAEDVFQATFLVLLRKAASLHWKESVGSWLYEVAYRLALKAKTADARRRLHEVQAPQPSSGDLPAELNWRELQTLLDEELHRLPASYRVPLILCYLEGATRDEAAQRLGWSLSTLKRRLERGRELLRLRLVRRGLTVSAALFAPMLMQNTAQAMLPASLARATVRTALQLQAGRALAELASAQVVALVEGGLKIMFMTNLKIATAMLVTVSLFAGAGALARQVLDKRPDVPAPAANFPRNAGEPLASKPQLPATKNAVAQAVEIRGRVLDPDGKPVTRANVYFGRAGFSPEEPPQPMQTTTAADGSFAFRLSDAEFTALGGKNRWSVLQVVAAAKGFGLDWAEFDPQVKEGLTLRLVKDDVPITGRVLDLQGRPVSADIRLVGLETMPEEDLTSYLKNWKNEPAQKALQRAKKILYDPSIFGLPKQVKTDNDGRFRLTGCGRERIVKLAIEAPKIETALVRIIPRPAAEVKTVAQNAAEHLMPGYSRQMLPILYGVPFEHVAGPTKLVVGTVRDKETGKPVAGVRISGSPVGGWWWETTNQIRAKTDAEGHYQLRGLPKSKQYRLSAYPGENSIYLSRAKSESGTDGLEPLTVDFEMVRGVEIRGRITDMATGKPVQTGLRYAPLQGNTHPGTDAFYHAAVGFAVKPDGTFCFLVPPGPGVLLVTVQSANGEKQYTQARLDQEDKGKESKADGAAESLAASDGQRISLYGVNAYRTINPPEDSKAGGYDLQLDPGLTQSGTVLGPDGQKLAGILMNDFTLFQSEPKLLETPSFSLQALDPCAPRQLLFLHKERKLGGHLTLRGDEKDAPTVKLEPLATVKGRLLDSEGQPMAGVQVHGSYRHKFILRPVGWWASRPEPITTDKDGYFQIDYIIPGLELSLYGRDKDKFLEFGEERVKKLSLRPGEHKDLGEIRVQSAE